MLNYLAVKNVSVIESVSLELFDGLTVLTGETGSGKSVLLGSLKLLLGDRFQKSMLREGADKLMVEGIFSNIAGLPADFKESFDIDDELIVRREVDDSGKNRVFINGKVATVAQLKDVSVHLVDIHGQHEHQTLLDEERHIELVDHLVSEGTLGKYRDSFKKYTKIKSERDKVLLEIDDVRKHQDIVEFQLNEITAAEIDLGQDVEIDEKILFLSNIEKIREACAGSLDALSEGESNAAELVAKAIRSLEANAATISGISLSITSLDECLGIINDVSKNLTALFDRQESSPDELDGLMRRKYLLQELIKKYGRGSDGEYSLETVVHKKIELQLKMDNFENSDDLINRLSVQAESSYKEALKQADELMKERVNISDTISKQVVAILGDLELPNSKFFIKFTPKENLDANGGVDACFYISVNAGFEPAPLAQVASGGEISRVMLALKEVFSDSDLVHTLFFDEIDTGISGRTAKRMADKLKDLGKRKQIIVITHLPVVAAAGGSHFYISKKVVNGVTRTGITRLSEDDRPEIIASMIAGEPTASAILQAKELLKGV